MHELSICSGLLDQVARVAADHGGRRVGRIDVIIGAFSGVEAALLERAFTASGKTRLGSDAWLSIETRPIRIACRSCGKESETGPDVFKCGFCGSDAVALKSGDELLLKSVELFSEDAETTGGAKAGEGTAHVQ